MSERRVRLTRVGNSTPEVKRYARDEANRPKRVIFCGCQNGEWRAREENLPPRWPETSMILPPKIERGKSNVRPFVRPQRLIRRYPPIEITGGAACITHDRIRAAKRRNIIEPSIYCYITDIIVVMRVDGLE